MEKRFWQMKSHARFNIIVFVIIALLPVPFLIAYKFNKAAVIIEIIMLFISAMLFLAEAAKGTFNRVFIGKDGFTIKKFFKRDFYRWDDVEQCKEDIVRNAFIVDICYRVFLKKKDEKTPKSIIIQKFKNADGELEQYIEVEPIRKKEENVKKTSITLDSWEKAVLLFARNIAILVGAIAAFVFLLARGNNSYIKTSARAGALLIPLFVVAALVGLMALLKRKKRVEMDSSGISVHLYSQHWAVDWRDVIEISEMNRKTASKMGKYFKITVENKESFPFSAIVTEKTKKLERRINEYYKPREESF